jgi:hypothetical protein
VFSRVHTWGRLVAWLLPVPSSEADPERLLLEEEEEEEEEEAMI